MQDAHSAESDCLALLRISQIMSPQLLEWFDYNACLFSDVPALRQTKPGSYQPQGVFPCQL